MNEVYVLVFIRWVDVQFTDWMQHEVVCFGEDWTLEIRPLFIYEQIRKRILAKETKLFTEIQLIKKKI
jgi:hypothetical protein